MGYRSDVRGEMTFSRPLTKKEAAGPELVKALDGDGWGVWELTEVTSVEEVNGGTFTRTTFTGLSLKWEGAELKTIHYGWEKTLQEIISALPADVQVNGKFEAWGEGSFEDWRAEQIYCVNRRVFVKVATTEWVNA